MVDSKKVMGTLIPLSVSAIENLVYEDLPDMKVNNFISNSEENLPHLKYYSKPAKSGKANHSDMHYIMPSAIESIRIIEEYGETTGIAIQNISDVINTLEPSSSDEKTKQDILIDKVDKLQEGQNVNSSIIKATNQAIQVRENPTLLQKVKRSFWAIIVSLISGYLLAKLM